jgi:hypothetical protein
MQKRVHREKALVVGWGGKERRGEKERERQRRRRRTRNPKETIQLSSALALPSTSRIPPILYLYPLWHPLLQPPPKSSLPPNSTHVPRGRLKAAVYQHLSPNRAGGINGTGLEICVLLYLHLSFSFSCTGRTFINEKFEKEDMKDIILQKKGGKNGWWR